MLSFGLSVMGKKKTVGLANSVTDALIEKEKLPGFSGPASGCCLEYEPWSQNRRVIGLTPTANLALQHFWMLIAA